MFNEHRYLLASGELTERDSRRYRSILDGSREPELYHNTLRELSRHLHRYHGEKVVILVDDYDVPVRTDYLQGDGAKLRSFLGDFLGAGLSGNPHLFLAAVTGVLSPTRDTMFARIKNVTLYSPLRAPLATCCGFTEDEVKALLTCAGQSDQSDKVCHWYSGYLFGGHTVYNPWSVMHFLADNERAPRPYWADTSSNELVSGLLLRHGTRDLTLWESLLSGAGIERVIDERAALDAVEHDESALWGLLVATGYLKAEEVPRRPGSESAVYRLRIPNRDVREVYGRVFRRWMQGRLRRTT